MKQLKIDSPAKINLILGIQGKRSDGYHELKTVMHSLSLADQIIITPNQSGLDVTCDHAQVPDGPKNLAYQAAVRLARLAGVNPQVRIKIKKIIPVAAGMGGGSSNAATVLLGLSKWWRFEDKSKLRQLAKSLGADVPFFLNGGCQLGIGRGDRLYRWPAVPGINLVIVNPAINVSTADVYKKFKMALTSEKPCINMMRQALMINNVDEIGHYLFNHLAMVTEKEYSVIGKIRDELTALGATATLMTGSGPTVFGIVPTKRLAGTIKKKMSLHYPYVVATQTGYAWNE